MRKIIAITAVLIIAGLGLFWGLKGKKPQVEYKTEKIAKGDVLSTVSATGTLNAVTTVQVGTQVSGTIKRIYVDFNSQVKKGQKIAELDPTIFQAQAEQSEARLFSVKAEVDRAQSVLNNSKRIRDRSEELFSKNFISQNEMETAQSNYDSAAAALNSAKASVKEARAALNHANTNLKNTKIFSPLDGTVISRNIDEGQTVAASFQTPTLFTIAGDLKRMQIDTNVDEADIGRITGGMEASFTVDAYPNSTFAGKVLQIRNAPIVQQNVVTYNVVISADNADLNLKPGMTANVSIIVSEKRDVLRVPNAALRFVPSDENSKTRGPKSAVSKSPGVWLLENGKPKRIEIKTGISDGNFTEASEGASEGQEVIVEAVSEKKPRTVSRGPRFF